jgi:hypothetical protein
MWPVEDIGRNSVSPSTIPRMIASIILMKKSEGFYFRK